MKPDKRFTPTPMMTIRGTIISNVEKESKAWDRKAFLSAFVNVGLYELTLDGEWGFGGISFNHATPCRGRNRNGGKGKYAAAHTAESFAKSLNGVMQSEIAKKLELSGYFTVSIDTGDEPVAVRIDIEDGKVSYQHAEYVWADPVTLPN